MKRARAREGKEKEREREGGKGGEERTAGKERESTSTTGQSRTDIDIAQYIQTIHSPLEQRRDSAPTRCDTMRRSVTRMGTRLHTSAVVHVHAVASRIKGVPVLLVGGESCVIVIVAPAPAEATTEISLDVL